MRFDSRVFVLTGASSGIGRRTAGALASEGARLCLAARREERLKEVLEEIGGEQRGHSYFVTDVSRRPDAEALAAHVAGAYGRCDALINNAGLSNRRSFEEPDAVEALEEVMATNFYGAVYCTKALLPMLIRSAPSQVVNVASVAGRLAFRAASSYCASKFALVGWSEALHFELAGKGVYVSLVEPGPLPTEGFPQHDLTAHPLLRRVLTSAEDVAAAIQASLEHPKLERMVPRWYYLLQLPRVLTPPLYRLAQRRFKASRATDRARPS